MVCIDECVHIVPKYSSNKLVFFHRVQCKNNMFMNMGITYSQYHYKSFRFTEICSFVLNKCLSMNFFLFLLIFFLSFVKCISRRYTIPKIHHSEDTPFRRYAIPKIHHSEDTPFRRYTIPKIHHFTNWFLLKEATKLC